MYSITKKFNFEAQHQLPWHEGACKNAHGHSYFGDIYIESEFLDSNGMLVDFGVLKEIVMRYDHSGVLYQDTAEEMAQEICTTILSETDLDARANKIVVTLWETANNMAAVTWRNS